MNVNRSQKHGPILHFITWKITETKASGRLIILHSLSPGLFDVHYHVSAELSWDFAARAIFQEETKNSAFLILKITGKDFH